MSREIRLDPLGDEGVLDAPSRGSAALQASPEARLTLRLSIQAPDPDGLEALRHARRSILREEWTLGLAPGEPSLETAIFSPTEISWTVPASERARAADRLRELEARANRALSEISRRR